MHIGARMNNVFDEDYFMRGKQSGKSLYEDYRWMPELTVPMVEKIIAHLGIQKSETVLDFGCARGYVVRAFYELGYRAIGVDISEWAIENADPVAKPFLIKTTERMQVPTTTFDWVIAKDVLEHIQYVSGVVQALMDCAVKGVFAVVPLSQFRGAKYVVEDYEKDVTHVQRLPLLNWVEMFLHRGWRVEASFRVPGVKDNYAQYPRGNGFLTVRRIKESA